VLGLKPFSIVLEVKGDWGIGHLLRSTGDGGLEAEKQNVSRSNFTENNSRRKSQERVLNQSHMYKAVRIKLDTECRHNDPPFFSFAIKFKSKTGAVFCEELNSFTVHRLKTKHFLFCVDRNTAAKLVYIHGRQ